MHGLSCIHISGMFGCLHEVSSCYTTKWTYIEQYVMQRGGWCMAYCIHGMCPWCQCDLFYIPVYIYIRRLHITISIIWCKFVKCVTREDCIFLGVYSKMNSLCRSLLILAALLTSTCAQLDGIRIFLSASDLNERFEGTGHEFECELRTFIPVLMNGELSVIFCLY